MVDFTIENDAFMFTIDMFFDDHQIDINPCINLNAQSFAVFQRTVTSYQALEDGTSNSMVDYIFIPIGQIPNIFITLRFQSQILIHANETLKRRWIGSAK